MRMVRALLPAFGAGFFFTLGGTGDKLAFQPEADSTVSKTFSVEATFSMDELSMIANGQDLSSMIGQVEMEIDQETHIQVTDTYVAVSGGRATKLLRTFDTLENRMSMQISPAPEEFPEISSSSPLEGQTVSFRWDEEAGEYERSFQEDDGDEDLLEGLEEDMDLRLFLPASEVDKDESWTVDLAQLTLIAMPGGNLHMVPEDMDVDEDSVKMFEELFGDLGSELGDLLDGECVCTYKGAHEEDGVRVAEIAIDLEVATTLDLSELLNRGIDSALEQSGIGDQVDFSIETADLNLDFEGSGTLLWNLEAGRMHSFQLSGDAVFEIDLAVGIEADGESQRIDASVELSGSIRQEALTN